MNKRATGDTTMTIFEEELKPSDKEVFETIFQELWDPLYHYATSILQDDALAKDMVQDVWIDFWERRHDIKNANIKAYLYKAVRFRVLKELRDSKFKASHLEALKYIYDQNVDEEKPVSPEETKRVIEKKLLPLPRKCKEVFMLSRLNGMKNDEIAEELDIAESTVENHMTKAIKLLKSGAALLFVFLVEY